ncbi:MAG TPA: hypothetical protein VF477_19980, partial [Mycobacterium sp.]
MNSPRSGGAVAGDQRFPATSLTVVKIGLYGGTDIWSRHWRGMTDSVGGGAADDGVQRFGLLAS